MTLPPHTDIPLLWSGEQEGIEWVGFPYLPQEHSQRPPPRPARASASLPCLLGLTLFLPPPSRLSSGKLQEFGVGDGSKLTLVPTVEAGLMVNGWGTVPQRLWRRRAAPSPESLVPSTHPARVAPASKQLPCPGAPVLRPERTLRAASPLFQSQASRPEQSVMQALESLTETQVRPAPVPPRPGGGGGGGAPRRPTGREGRTAQPSCQFGLVTQLPLPPPPSHSPPDLEGLLSHGGCHGGRGLGFHKPACGGDLGPRSHTEGPRSPSPILRSTRSTATAVSLG